jgi:hypothetical protein
MYAEDLVRWVPWSVDAIEHMRARGAFVAGVHYFQPGGPRTRVLYKWDAIVALIEQGTRPKKRAASVRPTCRPRVERLDVDEATAKLRSLLD